MLPLLAITLLLGAIAPDDPPAPTSPSDRPTVLVVVGVPGTPDYGVSYANWTRRWQEAATRAGAEFVAIGLPKVAAPGTTPTATPAPIDHDRLRDWLAQRSGRNAASGPLWLVLIGHGTFDGKSARFNLRGPDLLDTELADWLRPITGPVAVLDCSSSSGPFLAKLAAPNRVIITATKSGAEQNYARFGQYLADVWTSPGADLDKDGQTSLLEAVVVAARQTAEFYKGKARLSTEHALIEDNGDGRGTPTDWFEGVRPTKKPKDGTPVDGLRAHQFHLIRNDRDRNVPAAVIERRNALELQLAALRDRKAGLDEADYYRQLEPLMIDLAQTYAEAPPTMKPESGNREIPR